jgi:putative transposase
VGQVCERGLSGVELVIADEHRGLANAVRRLLPEARRQRCIVHLERNVLTKVPHRLRARVAKQLHSIFDAPGLAQAKQKLSDFASGLGRQVPEVRIRSTNGLERLHGEIKRRTRSVGAFPDRQSALRLVTAVALEKTQVWSDRRYLDMSLLKTAAEEKAVA